MTFAQSSDRSDTAFERWCTLAEKAAGVPIEAMGSATPGGLTLEPLYPRCISDAAQPWRAGAVWATAQRVDHPDPAQANALALADLVGGADALTLVISDSPFARGFGLAVAGDGLAVSLQGVELDLIALRLDAAGPAALAALAGIAEERRLASAALVIDGGCDPIGAAACDGTRAALDTLATALDASRRGGFAGCPLLADGRPYHEAGAGEVEELAAVLATAVAYLRILAASGVSLEAARDAVAMLVPVDADLLAGMAKLRAMRRLWARVEDACGLDARPLRLHAETSWRCMARRDPHTNAVRGALGAVAAGLGGADVVTVLPMTLAAGLPNAAARRLSRNTSRVLIDEAQLARVDDPAGGSGAIEAITGKLCESAWELFQEIEARGGLPAAGGWLRDRIGATAARRAAALAVLRPGIVGTSLFPDLGATGTTVVDATPRSVRPATREALRRRRDAEPFEALRDCGEAAGHPRVFLAALGAPAGYGPRAAFAANLFAVGGLAATAPASGAPADLAARFRASGARVACLCGTDEAYGEEAGAAIDALRGAGAVLVLLAGCDGDWRKKGVDALIHDGCEALQVLAAVLESATSRRG